MHYEHTKHFLCYARGQKHLTTTNTKGQDNLGMCGSSSCVQITLNECVGTYATSWVTPSYGQKKKREKKKSSFIYYIDVADTQSALFMQLIYLFIYYDLIQFHSFWVTGRIHHDENATCMLVSDPPFISLYTQIDIFIQ